VGAYGKDGMERAVGSCPFRARWDGQQRCFRGTHGQYRTGLDLGHGSARCAPQPSKLVVQCELDKLS
jgi:hypothetical protein